MNSEMTSMTPEIASLSALSIYESERLLFFVLLQLIIIIIAARAAGYLFHKLGQPRAVGEIIAGLLLGPSLLGSVAPHFTHYVFYSVPSAPITIISQIGLMLLMFQLGTGFDFAHLRKLKNSSATIMIAGSGILFPFILGMFLGRFSAAYLAPGINEMHFSLFLATAFSITAIPIIGRIMIEFDLVKTQVGVITISAAAVNDAFGWLLLAVISGLVRADFSVTEFLHRLGWLFLYIALCWYGVRPLLKRLFRSLDIHEGRMSNSLMAVVLIHILLSAMCTYQIGIFAIFGGFLLGVLVHEEQAFAAHWRKSVGDFVTVFFLPIFFAYTGLRTDISGLNTISLWHWCFIMIAAATMGKFGGTYIAARAVGLDGNQAGTIGIMMNTRGLMELIVLNVGQDLGVIPKTVFTMLVIMAISTTLITAPALRLLLPKIGHPVPSGIDA